MYKQTFNIFAESNLRDYLANSSSNIGIEIRRESDDYILNVNETEFVNHLISQLSIEEITIDFENAFVTTYEKNIPAEDFPRDFYVYTGKSYPKDIVVYHLPFSGNQYLLWMVPNTRLMWSVPVYIEDRCICFEIIAFRDDAQIIEKEADSNIRNIKKQYQNVLNDVREFNDKLNQRILESFRGRKRQLLKKWDLLASLSVPVKKKENLPDTFSIPTNKTIKKISPKPSVTEKGFSPDPTLDDSIYHDILKTINDFGKVMERYPSTYSDKDEEALRDLFLLLLEPRYEGSTTGETFNKSGKTDILMRYENSNLFVAECKIWKGQKYFLDGISQLLGYLTWRDSKSAIILFVRNKDFSSVLETVKNITSTHTNCLSSIKTVEEGWYEYRFHIIGDRNREIKLVILLFHIPS